jgi:peptidyl-prolyl cis-trans isomerase SurA
MRALRTLLIVGAVIGTAPQSQAAPEVVDGVQAVVHASVVTIGEVLNMSFPAEQVLARQYLLQPEVFQRKAVEARNESLEQLVQRQLILHEFDVSVSETERKAMVDKLISKDVDQDVEDEIRTRYGGNRISFIQTLHAQGITLERHRQQIRDRLVISWLRQKNIASEIIASPHRIEAYYLAHREEFKVEDEVKLRMIVLKCAGESEVAQTKELAEEILRKLKEGATFTEMATIHSEGSQRAQGGDLGWWEPSRLSKHLADTALSLQAGQHSGVLSRSGGDDYWVCQYDGGLPTLARHYVADTDSKKETMVEERRLDGASSVTNLPPPIEFYLMLVEDKRPTRFKTLPEVRTQIEKDLVAAEQTRLEKQWIARLKKKTFVRIF